MSDENSTSTPDASAPEPSRRQKPELAAYDRPTMPWERKVDPDAVPGTRSATAGLELLAAVLLFGGLGWWLDAKMGWTPWATIGLAMAGLTLSLIRLIRRATRRANED